MTREEAIKEIKSWDFLEGKEIEAIQTLIPELVESEDERIRKEIVDFIRWAIDRGSITKEQREKSDTWFSYLEKQKECVSNNFDDVWNEEDCEEIIAEGQKLTPRFKELLKEVCHAWYDRGAKLKKQKEQKHPDGCFTCGEYKKGYEAGRLNGFTAGYNKAMKEQKSNFDIHWENGSMVYVQKEQKSADDKAFEEWIDGWFQEHKEKAYPQITMDEKEFKNFCRGIRNMHQQKPTEWSEEDETRLTNTLIMLKEYAIHHYSKDDVEKSVDWLENRVKFFLSQYHGDVTMTEAYKMGKEAGEASHWKPTEHQMNILKAVKEYVGKGSGYWGEGLGSLIDDLEKLI